MQSKKPRSTSQSLPSIQAETSLLTARMEVSLSAQVRIRVEDIVQELRYLEGYDVKVGEFMFRIRPAQLTLP
ncbi:hypothetical protein AO263_30310 [Pseudomonas sp. NZIPFR-PS5]|nr:hypothetical protein AO263_30310 [Pseudomonas sp. NZIPFR-PS5]